MSSAAPRITGQDHLWSVDEHLADILATVRPLEPIELQLLDAQGCVLVEDVTVLRVVVREGFSADLARALKDDLITVLKSLDELKPDGHYDAVQPFAH